MEIKIRFGENPSITIDEEGIRNDGEGFIIWEDKNLIDKKATAEKLKGWYEPQTGERITEVVFNFPVAPEAITFEVEKWNKQQ